MNKSESKYFNTSLLMNQALIQLLNKKDYDFITIKEICKKAGVNRSTFYLHYDNIDDLLYETIENLNKEFDSYFNKNNAVVKNIDNASINDLILITPKYLIPYLNFVKEHKIVYEVSIKHHTLMRSIEKYKNLQNKVLFPIFSRFNIKENEWKYFSAYYINGINGVVCEWIKSGCNDKIETICDIIIKMVDPIKNKEEI